MEPIFDNSMTLLERSMDLRLARQNLIASNIANAETPGYRALDLDFEDTLRHVADSLRNGDAEAEGVEPDSEGGPYPVRLVADDTPSMGNENNTVLLERELGKLSQNALMFKAQADFMAKKLSILRNAIASPQG